MSVLAIVPARGGSKSIPGKNGKHLAGHPLLAWSVAAARQATSVTRVLVSTDDPELRLLALRYGAEAPFLRPAELAQDATRDLPVIEHALAWLLTADGYRPEFVVQLRPTSPLRPPGLVDAGVLALRAVPAADSLRTVCPPAQTPYKMWARAEGWLRPLLAADIAEPYNAPRQELPETLWQTGHLDIVRTHSLERLHSLTGERILAQDVDPRYAVDIDTLAHWHEAESRLGGLDCVRPAGQPRTPFDAVRLVVFDFDGVFTDDRVYVGEDGRESVACSRSDGYGLRRLRTSGVRAAVLSSEVNPVVAARCRKLRLHCQQGIDDKAKALRRLAERAGVGLHEVAYVGNDLNDLGCFELAGLAVAVADARPELRARAHWVLARAGGHGAVRELCELVIAARPIASRFPAEAQPHALSLVGQAAAS